MSGTTAAAIPDGLQGEQIPIEAQVVGLADVYERLVSRPWTATPVPTAKWCR